LTIARVGPFSEAIHRLSPGDPIWIRGPLGNPFTVGAAGEGELKPKAVLVAGGYGVAPLYFLAGYCLRAGWEVACVIGALSATDVVFVHRFAELGVGVSITTDDGSLGEKGMATDAAARLLEADSNSFPCTALYACGPEPMLDAVEALARAYSLPAQLSYERYMRCGFGVCGSCSSEGWLVCRDGPVKHITP
jgi:dihydroorotate dehydrogenase electron transfer subunit